jgi:hypothetical protein
VCLPSGRKHLPHIYKTTDEELTAGYPTAHLHSTLAFPTGRVSLGLAGTPVKGANRVNTMCKYITTGAYIYCLVYYEKYPILGIYFDYKNEVLCFSQQAACFISWPLIACCLISWTRL